MNKHKAVFLFLALILPICIFLFLKIFGKNEFAVKPLFVDTLPQVHGDCPLPGKLPYHIPDSILAQLPFGADSLIVLYLGPATNESSNQLNRVEEDFRHFPVGVHAMEADERKLYWKACVFFLSDSLDVVLLDKKGTIRGQYEAKDREAVDRLLTELSIILKQY